MAKPTQRAVTTARQKTKELRHYKQWLIGLHGKYEHIRHAPVSFGLCAYDGAELCGTAEFELETTRAEFEELLDKLAQLRGFKDWQEFIYLFEPWSRKAA